MQLYYRYIQNTKGIINNFIIEYCILLSTRSLAKKHEFYLILQLYHVLRVFAFIPSIKNEGPNKDGRILKLCFEMFKIILEI